MLSCAPTNQKVRKIYIKWVLRHGYMKYVYIIKLLFLL